MSFLDKPAVIELYAELPKYDDTVICKCVQNGVSELMVQYALRRSGWDGRICAYVLPTSGGRNRFVQTRIDPLLQTVPEYQIRTPRGKAKKKGGKKAAENLQLKEFGAGKMLFLGSNTPGDFLEFSADVLIVDEFDGCDPKNLSKARNRLRASPYPQIVRLGNPTFPGIGISRLYDGSDCRRYHHQCEHCNERQPIDWFVNVVEKTDSGQWVPRDTKRWRALNSSREGDPPPGRDLRPICRRCKEPFNRGVKAGVWVAEHAERHQIGYRMSRLDIMYPSQSLWPLFLEWLAAQGDIQALATFFCDVLGFAYSHAGSRLAIEDLQRVMTAPSVNYGGGYEQELITAGVDVGKVLNMQISKRIVGEDGEVRKESVFIGAFTSFGEVKDAILRYNVDALVIDERPEIRKASELRDWAMNNTDCQVWMCRFKLTPKAGREAFALSLDWDARVVSVDRTSLCDTMVDDIKSGRHLIPEDALTVFTWEAQMRAPSRRLDEAKQRIVWDEGGKADHYFFASCYDRVAEELLDRLGTWN